MTQYLIKTNSVIIGSSCFLGGFYITSGSGGLKDKAVAGNPSVTKLTHNNYIELNPSGIPNNDDVKIETTSPIFEEIIYLMNPFIF